MSKDSELTRTSSNGLSRVSAQAGTFLIELLRQHMDHTVSVDFHAYQAL